MPLDISITITQDTLEINVKKMFTKISQMSKTFNSKRITTIMSFYCSYILGNLCSKAQQNIIMNWDAQKALCGENFKPDARCSYRESLY